ncbi:hypothetical protein ODJ79_24545 [Actinoplanes sp. KI2]|nr:hypothetical protein [Actinoplanes sp. KI2]MCU7726908.1 hypothetical protein [Actinoplanes sp. KI2]
MPPARPDPAGESEQGSHPPLRHPVGGELLLAYESMELTAVAGLRLNAYRAEPGSPSQDALNLLAGWTVTTAG